MSRKGKRVLFIGASSGVGAAGRAAAGIWDGLDGKACQPMYEEWVARPPTGLVGTPDDAFQMGTATPPSPER